MELGRNNNFLLIKPIFSKISITLLHRLDISIIQKWESNSKKRKIIKGSFAQMILCGPKEVQIFFLICIAFEGCLLVWRRCTSFLVGCFPRWAWATFFVTHFGNVWSGKIPCFRNKRWENRRNVTMLFRQFDVMLQTEYSNEKKVRMSFWQKLLNRSRVRWIYTLCSSWNISQSSSY